MVIYGYGRVSTKEQNERRQIDAFLAEGIDERHIFIDKISGKSFERPQYNLLVGTEISAGLLREGDLLVLLSLDLNLGDIIKKTKKINIMLWRLHYENYNIVQSQRGRIQDYDYI
ncbi:recombinase family protein [Lacrimispora amygdalina]|uniref:recombinase family protein n=1 Tax=Lacrimispora amygdalina TaxID=253257 RepID=UPI000BE4770A|nr:recombinase family protein [Lacrimispora amygdalina]